MESMRSTTKSKQKALRTTLIGSVVFSFVIFIYLILNISTHREPKPESIPFVAENTTTLSNQEQASLPVSLVGKPILLKIPSINVDSSVEYVGLTPDGAMDVPKGPMEIAWFELGSRPGESGSAVIAGHYGWKNNIPAVFDDLHKLRIGDKVSVEDEKGVITTFVVREMKTYKKDEVAPEVFGSSDGGAHLNLITCTGTWSKADKTFSGRLVVFTDKE